MQLKAEEKQAVLAEGDYVTFDNVRGRGIIYQIVKVEERDGWNKAKRFNYRIKPVFGCFGANYRKASRTESGDYLKAVDLLTLGREYMRLGQFIRTAAMRAGMTEEEVITKASESNGLG